MIREIVSLRVDPAMMEPFEGAVRECTLLFTQAPGYRGLTLLRSIDSDGSYQIVVLWETLEDHTERFRSSAAFQLWRETMGSFYLGVPVIEHFVAVGEDAGAVPI